jgi:hypothetical protein
MGIKLDWQIEADRAYDRAGEDPAARGNRRRQRLRLLLFTVGVLVTFGAIAGVIWLRLYTVDDQLRRDLINVVRSEEATIRVGDFAQFMAFQRSAGDFWLTQQSQRFKSFEDLKTKSGLTFTGNVLSTEIDGSRGRAVIEEIIDGTRYQAVWFYWHYPDGWRHVPSDLTFWGNAQTITGKIATINYYQLDASLAQALADRVEKWWSAGCNMLVCGNVPPLTVQIVPDELDRLKWDPEKPNTLIVPSPLASQDHVRIDGQISQALEDAVADEIASHLIDLATNNLILDQNSDAGWLRQVTREWMAATFVQRLNPSQHSFIQSLNEHYGPQGISAVIHALTPKADISVVGVALKQPIEKLALDWRPFFQRRLSVEKTLLSSPSRTDVASFQALWDAANPAALDLMRQRMAQPNQDAPQVQAVAISPGPDGVARATVQATSGGQPVVIIFRLVNGAWKHSA